MVILVAGTSGVFGKVLVPSGIGNAIADVPRRPAHRSASLVALAMGAGALALSRINDAGYWMFTKLVGVDLSRYLLAQHVQVRGVNRPDRTVRRLLGTSKTRSMRRLLRGPCSVVAPKPRQNPATVRCTAPGPRPSVR
ncbi:hypothetical protein [Streptomyces sp. NPDC059010]|uniref:GntT/GntP/DsdX family permease n=1 Tax=Streptomyces sp. NPDC059010 TaxID=3346695 RepID=UPI00367BF313